MDTAKKALASYGGLGYGPIAPGTWGSAGAAVIYCAVRLAGVDDVLVLAALCAALAAAFTFLTAALGTWAERYYGEKDPGRVVTDEVAGYFVSVTLFVGGPWWLAAAGGFFFFRFFDITKLPPASWAEKVPGGWGIALDDVLAGIYACILNHLLLVAYSAWVG